MKATRITEKMPGFVKESIGQAQKRLTLIEGEARKLVFDTWTRVRQNDSLKTVEKTIEDWRKRYDMSLDATNLRKTAEAVGTEYSTRAFHSFGLATRGDIRTVERKIDRLRSDVRKLGKPKARK